jgi:DNA-binding PadR family transcriptional regulator
MAQLNESESRQRETRMLSPRSIGGPRGLLRLYILFRLSKERLSGYDLISSLNTLTGGTWRPASGSIYPILQSLRRGKLIEVVSRETRSKQSYSITRKGHQFLETQSHLLNEFAIKWNKIRLALSDLVSAENLSTTILESTKANRSLWLKIIETKGMPRSEISFRLKEYKLLLERDLHWTQCEIKELA